MSTEARGDRVPKGTDERNWEAFWRSGRMYRESVVFRRTPEGLTGRLLYAPEHLERIEFPGGGRETDCGDFSVRGRELVYHGREEIPVLTDAQYWGEEGDPEALAAMKRFQVARPYYSEDFPATRQMLVSYSFAAGACPPGVRFSPDVLVRTREKLLRGEPLRVQIYGDSIGQGMTSSGLTGRAPYLPTFSELFCEALSRFSGAEVRLSNVSEGGMTSGWGAEHMEERLTKGEDLYLFCWGMNDGSAGVVPEAFAENIRRMRQFVEGGAEFLLIAPMLPNPDAELTTGGRFLNRQPDYAEALAGLAGSSCAVADMTAFHRWLLERKPYADMTGNNINHPNDFLARCYAICLLEAVLGPDRERRN